MAAFTLGRGTTSSSWHIWMGGENNHFTSAYIFVHSEIFQHCLDGDGLLRNLIRAVSLLYLIQNGPKLTKLGQNGSKRAKQSQNGPKKKELTGSNLTSTSTGKTSLSLDWSLMVGILRAGGDQWACSGERLNDVLRPPTSAPAHLSSFRAMLVIYKCSGFKSSSGWNITYICSLSFITSIMTCSQRIVV